MSSHSVDLLSISMGTITAPAGCGKTHLIADALARHEAAKPILVLTHTNAGVAALKSRLDRAEVPPRAYRLSTIDGWAMRLASVFPQSSGCAPAALQFKNPKYDYPAVRLGAVNLLEKGHIADIIAATYSRIIVDEYQDCSLKQHRIILGAARTIPIVALGDPLQAIFGFGGDDLADWRDHVCNHIPIAAELNTPWRWINAGAEKFGRWLLDLRSNISHRRPIDLRDAPENVRWVPLDGQNDHTLRLRAVKDARFDPKHKIIVIADSRSPPSQRQFASQIPGATTVEAVDLRDLVEFAAKFDLSVPASFRELLDFSKKIMTEINYEDLVERLKSIEKSKNRFPPTEVEMACFDFARSRNYETSANIIVALNKQAGTRVYRPALFRACLKALQICAQDRGVSFYDAVVRMREQNRLIGRPLPAVAVGSTLLLKGLEAECAVILETETLDANNLYVAMTRGALHLAVCSASPIIRPR